MTGPDLDRTPPHRRPAVLAAALVAGLLVAALAGVGYALTRGGGGATTTEVAVVLTRFQGAPPQAIQDVRLVGGPGADLGLAATVPPVAPATIDAGVLLVTTGAYTGVQANVGGETLRVDAHAVLRAGTIQPLLVAAGDHRLSVFWGNEALNQGLALAAGQLTRAPGVVFTDQSGRTVPWDGLRGKVVVAAALDTGCSDTCPLYTAVLGDLERVLKARGWQQRVVIADISMDSERDITAELAAYASRFGADWELLRTDPASTLRFWSALHYSYLKLPASPGQIDWYTGRPPLYHLHHDSVALVFDADGYLRANVQGVPRLGHALTPALAALVSPSSALAQQQSVASWSITDLLDRLDAVLGEPAEADRGVEQAARVGAHAPDFSLPRLDGGTVSLHAQLGHPVVVNFFASWCQPCKQELPLLAGAAARQPDLTVLALDQGEGVDAVRNFLAGVLRPPQQAALTALVDGDRTVGGDYAATGLPVTVFVDSDGVVRATHVGQLDEASLQQGLAAIS
jgi:cytochrome c biogenesis protein CcmG/thiol:disulfide interchange protein DsbE